MIQCVVMSWTIHWLLFRILHLSFKIIYDFVRTVIGNLPNMIFSNWFWYWHGLDILRLYGIEVFLENYRDSTKQCISNSMKQIINRGHFITIVYFNTIKRIFVCTVYCMYRSYFNWLLLTYMLCALEIGKRAYTSKHNFHVYIELKLLTSKWLGCEG